MPNYRSLIAAAAEALVSERRRLTPGELAQLAAVPDALVPSLAGAAHDVRLAWCGAEVEVEGILSAKTGGCPEDCHFCSQSSRFESPVKATPFLDREEVLAAARETAALGASEFCIVLAVRGPGRADTAADPRARPADPARDRAQRRHLGRHPHRGAGGAPCRRGRAPLQPQPRDGAVVLLTGRHHALLRGPVFDVPDGATPRDGALLRGSARDGRERRAAAGADRAARRARPGRGAAELPRTRGRARPSEGGRCSSPWRRSDGSRCSASGCRGRSSAMPAGAR